MVRPSSNQAFPSASRVAVLTPSQGGHAEQQRCNGDSDWQVDAAECATKTAAVVRRRRRGCERDSVGGDLVGVNQRDLVTFEVDQERAIRMAPQMPAGVVRVAESGVRDRSDAAALAEAGYHALLVGETLVTSGDPAKEIRRLRGLA